MVIMVPEDVVKLAVRWVNNTYTAFPGDRWDTGEIRNKMMDISTTTGRYSDLRIDSGRLTCLNLLVIKIWDLLRSDGCPIASN